MGGTRWQELTTTHYVLARCFKAPGRTGKANILTSRLLEEVPWSQDLFVLVVNSDTKQEQTIVFAGGRANADGPLEIPRGWLQAGEENLRVVCGESLFYLVIQVLEKQTVDKVLVPPSHCMTATVFLREMLCCLCRQWL